MRFVGFYVNVQHVLLNFIKTAYKLYLHSLNQGKIMLKIFTIKKIVKHYNDWIIMEFLDNKTPQVDFDKIHVLIIAGMFNNKVEPAQANSYGDISSN